MPFQQELPPSVKLHYMIDVNVIMHRLWNSKNIPLVSLLKWSLIFFIGIYGAYLFLKFLIAILFLSVLKTF